MDVNFGLIVKAEINREPKDLMRKILVTGATGFIGFEVPKQLAEQGAVPRLMVRRPLRSLLLKSLKAERMQADLLSPQSLDRLCDGVDGVIHLGGRATFEPYHLIAPSLLQGSINVMQAAIHRKMIDQARKIIG
jgi:nucleoside-diphosphate-sugar epimerase